MAINVWQPQGAVIASEGSVFYPVIPNVIFEGNAKILSGNVFKMWYIGKNVSVSALKYAESTDGINWTLYSSNPVLNNVTFCKVRKVGSTYYAYANPSVFSGTGISVYTSPDGLTWTLQLSNAIAPEGTGWEQEFTAQLAIVDIIDGTWYGYYTGQSAAGAYGMGLATSTDGIHWTKGANNPIASLSSGTFKDGSSWVGSGDFCFLKIKGTYYGWSQTTPQADPGATNNLPSDIMRWSAPSPSGPWTALGSLTYYRNAAIDGIGVSTAQVADPCLLEVNGKTYLYYSAVQNQTSATANNIALAIANMPLVSLVGTYEGVQNIPIPHALSLNKLKLGSDNFQRANANPIGAPWENVFSNGTTVAAQIVSDALEGTALMTGSDILFTTISPPPDQYSECVPAVLSNNTGSAAELLLRITNPNTATPTYLRLLPRNESGGTQGFIFQTVTAGSFTTVFENYTVTVGHTLTACVVGTTLSFFDNGSLLFVFTGVTPTSGGIGTGVEPIAALSDATLSSWNGGAVVNPPGIPGKRGTRSK